LGSSERLAVSIVSVVRSVVERLEVRLRYNPYTIAELFRKQGAQVGDDCHFGIMHLATEPYLVRIGNHVGIASGVQLLTHGLGWCFRDRIPELQNFGRITIGDNCNIGVNAIILPNVTIGRDSMVGAGAVVTKDVPAGSIVAGNPARLIGRTEAYFVKAAATWELQRPPGYLGGRTDSHLAAAEFARLRSRSDNRNLLRHHLVKLFWGSDGSPTK
jgi:acetyltransferase-like isoleucine patch superfamily enzyme